MTYSYNFNFIPGTAKYVCQEISTKHPRDQISHNHNQITIHSDNSDIFDFADLLSPLSITNDQQFTLDLKKQTWRKFTLPASTNPSLAYILCQIANLQPSDILYDPFCGAGTIPITALLHFHIKQAFASDLSGQAIDYCEQNRALAHISPKKLVAFRANISMTKLKTNSITKIISNLPFGIRTGTHEQNIKIYQILSHKIYSLLNTSGMAIILTQEKKLFQDVFSTKFQINKITTVDIGGLTPTIYQIKSKQTNMIS